jgi:hypothetical protein
MKAILEFNLPEETYEHQTAINAHAYRSALGDMDQRLRDIVKYGTTEAQSVRGMAQMLRDELHATMEGAPFIE